MSTENKIINSMLNDGIIDLWNKPTSPQETLRLIGVSLIIQVKVLIIIYINMLTGLKMREI